MEGITVKCPECGHRMTIDPKVIAFRCSQCGKKIDLDEDPIRDARLDWPEFNEHNTAHTDRKVDEAELIKAKMEYEKHQEELRDQQKFQEHPFIESAKILLIVGGAMAGFSVLAYLLIMVLPDLLFHH